MSITYLPNKNLGVPSQGSYPNSWATPVNADWAQIDTAFGGVTNLDLTTVGSSPYTLTVSQYTPPNLNFSGSTGADFTVQIPSGTGGIWSVSNTTPHNVLIGNVSGTGTVTIPASTRQMIVSDGSKTSFAQGAGGSNTQVQFNSSGVLGGSTMTFNSTAGTFTIPAPTSGVAFSATGVAGQYAAVFTAANDANSLGLSVVGTATLASIGPLVSFTNTGNPNGVTVQLTGNGSTPAKAIRVQSGSFLLLNNSGSSIFNLSDAGLLTLPLGGLSAAGNAQTPSVVVTYGATTTLNCALSNVFTTTLTGNITTVTISNPSDGQTINWFLTQDATGGLTIAWPSSFKWPGGTAGVLSTAANAVDLLVATYRAGTGFWYATLAKGFA